MQVSDVVFNLVFGRYVGVGVGEILLEIGFVGFEGFLVEFFSVFAEFKVFGEVGFDGHGVVFSFFLGKIPLYLSLFKILV